MPPKKKGPSMRENQQRKLTMQKIAKGGKSNTVVIVVAKLKASSYLLKSNGK
jgi:hypothetical protein